jgi:nitrite reductase (NADH) small subunit
MVPDLFLQHLMRDTDDFEWGRKEKRMSEWVRLCGVGEAPAPGAAMEAEARGVAVCLANIDGRLSALDNWCPHRHGPLGQGWVEGTAVVCPWHSWAFDAQTGVALPPERAKVDVFPVKVDGDDVLIELN